MFWRKDVFIAPLCEAALLFIVAFAGWLTHKPFIFASLGPTAYELIETPERQTARPYNVLVGHLIGVVAGFLGIFVTNAWNAPAIGSGSVSLQRMGASVIAAGLTVFLTLLLRASQPAAVATTLLIALGVLQRGQDAFIIMGSVILILIPGEALRIWRLRDLAKSRHQAFWRA
jgi:CBS domain-containing membrane protein